EDFRTLVTDAAGKASVRGLRFDAREIHLRYTHDDYASLAGFDETVSLTPDAVTTEHELRLVRAGRVSGKVLDADGQPVSGARVTAGLDANPNNPRAFSSFDGHYEIKGVPPGPSVATVHASGYAPDLHPVEIRPGDAATADFALRQGLTLTGFVRVDSGEPHAGVEVEAIKWRGFNTLGLRGFTDKEGRFVINDAPHDEFDLSVTIWRGGVLTQTVRAGSDDPVVFVTPAVRAITAGDPGPGLNVGDPAPAMTLTALDGAVFSLSKLKGSIVIIDFWATWCMPCIAELPQFAALHDRFKARKDVVFLGISLDGDEKTLRDFLKKRRMDWPQIYGDAGGASEAANVFGAHYIPAVFIIGPDGHIAAARIPARDIAPIVERLTPKAVTP
ncbi:MAG TPA: carboxypeptidase regulatory-like domain-containing protein, partial [Arenibaculum sp.]|nr:carboxypeptidase regulatory-like domain-containing protein [Arenibaculum sp.]